MIYLDTSVLGALFFREPTASAILARLETVGKDDLCVSAWNLTEMASVGAIKERTGSIDAADRAVGLTAFNRFVSDSLPYRPLEKRAILTSTVEFPDKAKRPLQQYDGPPLYEP